MQPEANSSSRSNEQEQQDERRAEPRRRAPLHRGDGTLCAIDPKPQSPDIEREQPVLDSYAELVEKLVVDDAQARRN